MTAQIDDAFLNDLGLGNIATEQKEALVGQLIETLQLRVGERLSQDLTDEQIADFERVTANEETAADAGLEWLQKNNPNYPAIVNEETEKLKQDLRTNLDVVAGKKDS
ncbi:MAG TPA: DUF5663 domain-containing protein [Candidatus Saccharimonadales bacterium]|nr:DUF5663 domain-containing protein [Candidatus Saccharimonadales bacterium]